MNGLELIRYEMARQHDDAMASFLAAAPLALNIAESVKRTGRLCLLGMGGSHWANRTAMFAYRELGIEVQAEVLSEVLFRKMPDHQRTVLLVSQSGNSGEIAHYLKTAAPKEERFGLTLNAESVLAESVPSLIAAGGIEKAFAATRSIFLTHALHLAILNALGDDVQLALEAMKSKPETDISTALNALVNCKNIILSGRSELQGAAESGALCLMELARMNTYALEGGQLRHGPLEMLDESYGIVLLRGADETVALTPALAEACNKTGARIVVFDLSGESVIANTTTLSFSKQSRMAAVFAVMPTLQKLLVEIANRKVLNVGVPLRSTKVTTAL
jgi:fructoselysine-6-P-deglycase FrlB-like protein